MTDQMRSVQIVSAGSKWTLIVGKGFLPGDWEEYVATVALGDWKPQFIVLHNTAVPTFADWHSARGEIRMQNLQSFYRDSMKWSAGPHVFVADDFIWAFTPLNVPGVHSPSWNHVSWGVELVGDYEVEPLSPAVRDNAVLCLAALHRKAGLNPNTLRLHHEDPRTTHKGCPGKNVVKQEIIDAIAGLATGGPATDAADADPGAEWAEGIRRANPIGGPEK